MRGLCCYDTVYSVLLMFVNCYICSKRILYCFGLIYIENEKLRGRQFTMFGETTDVAFKLSSPVYAMYAVQGRAVA